MQKSLKIGTPMDQVIYAKLFLTGRALKWFKSYLIEIQINKMSITNQKVKYMFINWEKFANQLIQMYGDLKVIIMAK